MTHQSSTVHVHLLQTQAQCLACNKNTMVHWCGTPQVDPEK